MSRYIRSRQSNGRFRRTTLKDFGFTESDLSDGSLKKCLSCGKESRPILTKWSCECGAKNG